MGCHVDVSPDCNLQTLRRHITVPGIITEHIIKIYVVLK